MRVGNKNHLLLESAGFGKTTVYTNTVYSTRAGSYTGCIIIVIVII